MENNKKASSESIEYYYSNNRYKNLLFVSRKWKDIICSKEALVSCLISLLSSGLVYKIYISLNVEEFCSVISTLVLDISIGLLGLLGFLIGGLAIISSSISNKILKNINDERKFKHLINIVFAFYFIGSIIGFTIVFYIFIFLLMNTNWYIYDINVLIVSFSASYLFWFNVIYSVMLLGTSLRLLILSYRFEYDPKESENKNKCE